LFLIKTTIYGSIISTITPEVAAVPNPDTLPNSPLTDLAVTLLTPMFLTAAHGDAKLAGRAAEAMLEDYGANTQAEMLCVVQIIAFAMACLNTLTLSMAEDAPPNIALRACNCADRLSKAEMRHRTLHEKQQREAAKAPTAAASDEAVPPPPPYQAGDPPPPIPPAMLAVLHGHMPPETGQGEPLLVPPHVQAEWRRTFGESAVRVANAYEAALGDLPPEEREAQRFRIETLRRASQLLLNNQPLPEYPDMLFAPEEPVPG
jgi:hypothetical protein